MPVRTIHTEHDIDAPPERLWALLTDFDRFPQWNPLHRRITLHGPFRAGTRISISLKMDRFRSVHGGRLVGVEDGREFGWVAQAGLIPALVVVERSFRVEPRQGGSRLVQHEVDSGLAVGLLFAGGRFERKIRRGYDGLVAAIRARLRADAAGQAAPAAPAALDNP